MTGRDRFRETMRYGVPDRVPCFDEGIRKEVLEVWRGQGLGRREDLTSLFTYDLREDIAPDLYLRPYPTRWPDRPAELSDLGRRLDPEDPKRMPKGWEKKRQSLKTRDHVAMLRVHQGFFLTLGVEGWKRFHEVMYLVKDAPDFVREIMALQGRFAARMAEKVLADVPVDAAVFGEPIGGNDRALISPAMYEDLVLPSYEPVLEVLARFGVETIVWLTYGNTRALIPSAMKWGFNCLWASEANPEAMDYRGIREEFGRGLRLIGGIDLDALRQGREAIRREIEEKVPSLLADGGFIPLADGRMRAEIPFENYVYYRRLLEETIKAHGS